MSVKRGSSWIVRYSRDIGLPPPGQAEVCYILKPTRTEKGKRINTFQSTSKSVWHVHENFERRSFNCEVFKLLLSTLVQLRRPRFSGVKPLSPSLVVTEWQKQHLNQISSIYYNSVLILGFLLCSIFKSLGVFVSSYSICTVTSKSHKNEVNYSFSTYFQQ